MNQEFSELVKYLDEKFGKVDTRFNKLFNVFATKEDVQDIKKDIGGLKGSLEALTISVDKLAKAVGDMHQEYIAIIATVDRHEKWIKQIAEKLGVKLEH